MSWSRTPPSEPGWYWTIPTASEIPGHEHLSVPMPVSFAGTFQGVPMLHNIINGSRYPMHVLAPAWWGEKLEPPPWPSLKESKA